MDFQFDFFKKCWDFDKNQENLKHNLKYFAQVQQNDLHGLMANAVAGFRLDLNKTKIKKPNHLFQTIN